MTTSSTCRTTGALLSPVRVKFTYEVVRPADDARAGDRHTVHASLDRDGRRAGFPIACAQLLT